MTDFFQFYFVNLWAVIYNWWWLIAPFFLFSAVYDFWMRHQVVNFFRRENSYILDIKVPPEQERSPKIMENVIDGFWTLAGEVRNFMETVVEDERQDQMSLEIIGIGGEIHFGVWIIRDKRVNFFKAHIYAHYPEAEITVRTREEDYLDAFPMDVPNDEWNCWGTAWTLERPDAYPIRTYPYFEDSITGTVVDPLASALELMSSLKPGEILFYQLLAIPVDNSVWFPKYKNELEKNLERGKYKEEVSLRDRFKKDILSLPLEAFKAFFDSSLMSPQAAEEQPETNVPFLKLSPGEQLSLKAMEINFSKRGFMSQYRTYYIARREVYDDSRHAAMMGVVNQFNSVDSNSFNIYKAYFCSTTYLFAKGRGAYKRRRMIRLLKRRQFSGVSFILNTEEIATVWHFPDISVKAVATPRVDYKKASAPSNLPLADEER